VRAAADALAMAGDNRPKLLAVTLLTSLAASDLLELGIAGSAEEAVVRLGSMAVSAGADGLVCSALEVATLREKLGPSALLVVPGIRAKGATRGDQTRVATAAEAVKAGADYVVVGRPLREAADPRKAAGELAAEMDSVET
jgi:orotidine-5'-phosphate decarboxylase